MNKAKLSPSRRVMREGGVIDTVHTTVCGIPCIVAVTGWGYYRAATFHDPAEGEDHAFRLYDRRGYAAKWLERKLESDDCEAGRLQELLDDACASYYAQD